jgi:hypothetical protein
MRTHDMGRADGTFLGVGLIPWVETHGYQMCRADGPKKESLVHLGAQM